MGTLKEWNKELNHGTIGQRKYFFSMLAVAVVGCFLLDPKHVGLSSFRLSGELFICADLIAMCFLLARITAMRCRDIGWTPWWSLFILIPGPNMLFFWVYCFTRSKVEPKPLATQTV